MSQPVDPYRLLGLAPGASLDEVKRAYRRLAKEAHPDSAGPAATARFIAVQGAYEAIVRGGARPPAGSRSRSGPAPRPTPPSRPHGRPAPGARPGPKRRPAGPDAAGAGRGSTGEPRSDAGGPGPSVGDPARAGLGTTSYDGAEVESSGWGGASWYGPATGTYWTVNPKEYADPRKHGPEYLARGRGRARPYREADRSDARAAAATASQASAGTPAAEGRREPPPVRTEAAADGDGRPAGATAASGGPAVAGTPTWPRSTWSGSLRLGADAPRRRARLLVALLGWPPIGVALAAFAGWLTGCGRYAATCPAPLDLAPVAVHAGVLALLFGLPRLATIAGAGTLALLVAMVPAALLLSAASGYERPSTATTVLFALLAAAWLGGAFLAASGRARLPVDLREGPPSR